MSIRSRSVVLITAVGTVLAACSGGEGASSGKDDLVLVNGKVYTGEADAPWAQSVAVRNGRIVYVGDDAGARSRSSARTVDLHGKMVTPGFIDGHNHAYLMAESIFWANVTDGDVAAKQQKLREFRAAHPDAKQIRAVGWDSIAKDAKAAGATPRQLIDAAIGDVPVAIISNGHHSLFVNTKALESAGVTRDTPQPAGGTVEKDEQGNPNGILQEFGAQNLVISKLPQSDFTVDEYKRTIARWQEVAARDGITSAFVPIHYPTESLLKAFKELDDEGGLTVRFDLAQWVDETKGAAQVPHLVEMREKYRGKRFALDSAKIFADGVGEHKLVWDQKVLNETVDALNKAGLRVYTHAIGDPGFYPTAAILDAYEYAAASDPAFATKRHAITHSDWLRPEDIGRSHRLGVLNVPQPPWFGKGWYRDSANSPEGANAMRYKSLIDGGVTVVGSSDFPSTDTFVRDMQPLAGIEVGITRLDPDKGKPGDMPQNPQERGTLPELLQSYTINGARLTFTEKDRGTVEVGKAADLTVLERNLFDVEPTSIGEVPVVATLFEGNAVFGNDALR